MIGLRQLARAPWWMGILALTACQQHQAAPENSDQLNNGVSVAPQRGNETQTVERRDGAQEARATVDNQSTENSDSPTGPAFAGDCSLKIDGKTYLDIRKTCPIYPLNDGNSSLIVNSDGETKIESYFVYLLPKGDGTASISWNEDPGANHAWAQLGDDFRRDGACWSNARAEVCATRR